MQKPVYYLMMVICETMLVIIVFIANGIMLDAVSENNNSKYLAKYFEFNFLKDTKASEISDKINEMVERLPLEYEYINIFVSSRQQSEAFYGAYPVKLFPSYQDMVDFMFDTFGVTADNLPTQKQYENHEKVVIVGNDAGYYINDKSETIYNEYKLTDDGHLILCAEEYLIAGHFAGAGVYVFWGAQPEETLSSGVSILLNNVVSEQQAAEISDLVCSIFGDELNVEVTLPETQSLLEQRKNFSIFVITVFMQIVVVFNIMLIFKYMVISKSRVFAIYRFCGYGVGDCIVFNYTEFFAISLAALVLACITFELWVKQLMSLSYGVFTAVFTPDYYAFVVLIFLVISTLLYFIYIYPSLKKFVAEEVRKI